ncbi:hypothetical protein AO501_01070 [Mycobacterium gordonae]|uniref:DUF2563 family protein n=1 Tax=Mycobacterium gordonae TaxID=1778 RepID=A0A0Q2LUX1_MYCGO|nr:MULTISPECIES: DUF2563 family protein [Mycobacterium]KQH79594.1 hypothetical protein AO501_01070 [Mycobacterium gordonae]MDP7727804.1 DUF2563 family protein [Mycobacterium sp. TY813]
MFVDAGLLRSGGDQSRQAGDHAHRAAGHLSRAELPPGMFGDFAAAESFYAATGSVQVHHARLLLHHSELLDNTGSGAAVAAEGFTGMDESNAETVRAVRCDSAT